MFFFFFYSFENLSKVFKSKKFDLPKRWNGIDFIKTLTELFEDYIYEIKSIWRFENNNEKTEYISKIQFVCNSIISCVREYLNGYQYKAFQIFNDIFTNVLMRYSLTYDYRNYDNLDKIDIDINNLYRARKVEDDKIYSKDDIFHPPFNNRRKIDNCRYSIAGYPSLYLSTSLQLCLKELKYEIKPGRYIASKFSLKDCNIRILDLGIKPSDFRNRNITFNGLNNREKLIRWNIINEEEYTKRYLIWYPVLAASSFICINENDAFHVEYLIPQFLMQAIRMYKDENIAIRYFSSSSIYASNMGMNYVFPTHYKSGENDDKYCNVLKSAFEYKKPVFIHEYNTIDEVEDSLKK